MPDTHAPSDTARVRERILFVCTGNVDRSRTAEDLYRDDPRYEVRSAGTAPFASTPISSDLLRWADRVFVMCEREDAHETQLRLRFPGMVREIVDLDVVDRWPRGHPDLVERLRRKLGRHLGEPIAAEAEAEP